MTKVKTPPGPLQTERLPNGNRMLLRDLVVVLDAGTRITVPTGFETDYSSVPFVARPLVRWSKVDIAGVVHDFLYWCPQQAVKQGVLTRGRADEIWWELAGAGQHSANTFQQWVGWAGLRAFGGIALRNAQRTGGRKCSPSAQPAASRVLAPSGPTGQSPLFGSRPAGRVPLGGSVSDPTGGDDS